MLVAHTIVAQVAMQPPPMPTLEGPTYFLELNDGRSFYAYEIKGSGGASSLFRYQQDDPWPTYANTVNLRKSDFTSYPPKEERKTERERRWAKRYEEGGYKKTLVNSGEVWLTGAEVTLADRARDMAKAVETRMTEAGAPSDPAAGDPGAPLVSSEKPSFLKQWGGHLAVALGSIFLMGLVIKFFVLTEAD